MTTQADTDRRAAALDTYRADLASGQTLRYAAASFASGDRLNYAPVLRGRDYAALLGVLATFSTDDRNADTAAVVLRAVNRHGNTWQMYASIARALETVVRDGWTDVARMSGPEPGRPSSWQHPTTLRDAALLAALFVEIETAVGQTGSNVGLGWALRAVLDEVDPRGDLTRYACPRVHSSRTVGE